MRLPDPVAAESGLAKIGEQRSMLMKALPVGGMCQFAVRISGKSDVDAEVVRCLRAAYEAAG